MRPTILLLLLALAGQAEVSPERYKEHVKFLASDALKGRGNDQPELAKAARYVADRFKECGLEPVKGGYFQKFSATIGSSAGTRNRLGSYTPEKDFQPLGISDSGTFSGEVVFAGYGITAEEYHYDDYQGLEAKGKIVLVLRHEPQENDEKSVFLGKEFTRHADIVQKALNARAHGAAAMLLVNDPMNHGDDGDPFIPVDSQMGPEQLGMLALQVKRTVADALLASTGRKLLELQEAIDRDLSNQSRALRARLEGQADVTRKTRELENVMGLLSGRNSKHKDEVIILGAHYDHLGLGGQHSLAPNQTGQIHHGADDNASGTAGVIELACSLRGAKLDRSVLFLAFAGEEMGLLGSAHYVKTPVFPLEQTTAMINLDMIGRAKERKVYVGGVGTAQEFRGLVEEENKPVGLKLEFSNTGYDASDHTSFNSRQVPVLFFFSGLHADYHKPSDTWEKIDAASAADILRLAERIIKRLDGLEEKPLFVRVAEPARPAGGGGGGYGPYFGSIPDMGESVSGVRFADVRTGSPADLAGLKAGDVMVELGGKPIKNLYDFTFELRARKPGDKVSVTVVRGPEKLTVEVTLGKRP